MLLEIKNLLINFGSSQQAVCAVDTVSLSIGVGETVCLVGESGSEKTVTALSIARLLSSPPAHYPGGEILLEGRSACGRPGEWAFSRAFSTEVYRFFGEYFGVGPRQAARYVSQARERGGGKGNTFSLADRRQLIMNGLITNDLRFIGPVYRRR